MNADKEDRAAQRPKLNIAAVATQIRVARPTSQLATLIEFYCNGLGLEVIDRFRDHGGFSGVMLGLPGTRFHLEFTSHKDERKHLVGLAPTKDNLLVFYVPDSEQFASFASRMESLGYPKVAPVNPYWADVRTLTFEDPDGWRVVVVPTPYS